MVFEAQRSVLVKFVRKCRRYFAPGTAVEVWAEFAKPLTSPLQPAAFEVLDIFELARSVYRCYEKCGESRSFLSFLGHHYWQLPELPRPPLVATCCW